MVEVMSCKNILHYPQLDTVLMVEEFIKEHSGEYQKKEPLGKFTEGNDVPDLLCDYRLSIRLQKDRH